MVPMLRTIFFQPCFEGSATSPRLFGKRGTLDLLRERSTLLRSCRWPRLRIMRLCVGIRRTVSRCCDAGGRVVSAEPSRRLCQSGKGNNRRTSCSHSTLLGMSTGNESGWPWESSGRRSSTHERRSSRRLSRATKRPRSLDRGTSSPLQRLAQTFKQLHHARPEPGKCRRRIIHAGPSQLIFH